MEKKPRNTENAKQNVKKLKKKPKKYIICKTIVKYTKKKKYTKNPTKKIRKTENPNH